MHGETDSVFFVVKCRLIRVEKLMEKSNVILIMLKFIHTVITGSKIGK